MQNPQQVRRTRQRAVILEELRRVDSHPSADELYLMVRRRLPRISLGTIYRNLDILTEAGEIRRIDSGSTLKRFDGTTAPHHHIRCVRCDRIADAHIEVKIDIDERIQRLTGFRILGHHVEFLGLCPRCHTQPAAQPSLAPEIPTAPVTRT
ncbi:MAG: transcriptional repressor [Desulfobacterales bacterium]|nr:transcriptional repressor [Desulfobacterales bacterium]